MGKVYQATVRRDAQTITPVQVPMHEVAILKELFGEENVTVGAEGGDWEPTDDEHARLSRKYGPDVVRKVYGAAASGGLDNAMKKQSAKPNAKNAPSGAE
jgi:hypothetical protein